MLTLAEVVAFEGKLRANGRPAPTGYQECLGDFGRKHSRLLVTSIRLQDLREGPRSTSFFQLPENPLIWEWQHNVVDAHSIANPLTKTVARAQTERGLSDMKSNRKRYFG
jgi:hypothetical protein